MTTITKAGTPIIVTARFHGGRVRLPIPVIITGSNVSEVSEVEQDESVASLAGTYADAPFMENFSEFLEQHRREINRLYNEE